MTTKAIMPALRRVPAIRLSPGVVLLTSAVAILPFISTSTCIALQFRGMALWKTLWLCWLAALAIVLAERRHDFVLLRGEAALWAFLAFMLLYAPAGDTVIDPWKSWFFCIFTALAYRVLFRASGHELHTLLLALFGLWWTYLLILLVYVMSIPVYPGSIQHQFFLSGLLGFLGVALLLRPARAGHDALVWLFLFSTLCNLLVNLGVTETRSIFPFSVCLAGFAGALFYTSATAHTNAFEVMPSSAARWRSLGLPLALVVMLIPVLHLNGNFGNLINEFTYPVFGKLRTIESATGREAAFKAWSLYLSEHARWLTPASGPMPHIRQEADVASRPLFGLSNSEYENLKDQGRLVQEEFRKRTPAAEAPAQATGLMPVVVAPSAAPLAILSSHNLWLDAAARSGIVYAVAVLLAWCLIIVIICLDFTRRLPAPLTLACLALAMAWGVASQFDDEHWLYHIPYLSFFFIPVLVRHLRQDPARPHIKKK